VTSGTPRAASRLVVVLLAAALAASVPARAQAPASAPPASGSPGDQPFFGSFEMPGIVYFRSDEQSGSENEFRMTGNVEIDMGQARILADQVVYRKDEGTVEATGNVVLSFTGVILSGSRVVYRVEPQTGWVEDAVGYLDQANAILRAKRIERLGPERLAVEDADFTTCTQPTPYWSFHLGRGTFHLDHYAYLHNVAFKAGHVPAFWSPYLVWPIKAGRAAGLLFPKFGNSNQLGTEFRLPFYWPIAPNADLTLTFNAFTKVGVGLTADLDWLPTYNGWSRGRLNWVNDTIRGKNRYLLDWRQSQPLAWDTKLTASIRRVSDFDYFTDYETDLQLAAAPQTVSIVELTRDWSWYTLSARTRRYQQYFPIAIGGESLLASESINDTLPQVELRGRSQRLGRTPLFLSFESSASIFARRILRAPEGSIGVSSEEDLVTEVDDTWSRADVAPQVQWPVLKQPWGDLTLTAGWRGTYWSGSRDPEDPDKVTSEPVFRSLWNAGFQFQGPRFQRIWETPNWSYSTKLKHVIEPFVQYGWRPESAVEPTEIPFFDSIDQVPGELSDFNYGIRQRFLALRRPETARRVTLTNARETSFEALEEQAKRDGTAAPRPEDALSVDASATPVEFASIEIAQSYSFVRPLSLYNERAFSPIRMRIRLNPTAERVLDASATYDVANSTLTELSLSALVRLSDRAFVQGSWYRREPPASAASTPSSFVRARWEVLSRSRRVGLATDWDFNVETKRLEHQRYQLRVATQCCSFRFGYDRRDFVDNFRQEFSLVVDLSGIGNVLDLVRSE
jgi:lipopolysaccharide assembly outer membrane protein LptD (OstA)